MGQIYALSGCSGVGKSTFLNLLFSDPPKKLRLLNRTTSRDKRLNEREGIEYDFLPEKGFLQKIFANDFVHIEEYEGAYFGIEAPIIEDTINSNEDGIIMAGVFGASKLKAVYGDKVSFMFMTTSSRKDLRHRRCLNDTFEPNIELLRRLNEKIEQQLFNQNEFPQNSKRKFIKRRMALNYLELAFINGRLRSNEQILVLENYRNKMDDTLSQFHKARK